MAEAGLAASVLLALFQLCAAGALLALSTAPRWERSIVAALFGVNALASLAAGIGPGNVVHEASLIGDVLSPFLIFAFALALRGAPRWPFLLLGALAAGAVVLYVASPTIVVYETFAYAALFASYAAIIVVPAWALAKGDERTWTLTWIAAAFLVRSADFAVRFGAGSPDLAHRIPPLILGALIVGSLAWLLRAPRTRRAAMILLGTAVVGAGAGAIIHGWAPPDAVAGWNLVSLTLARPLFIVLAYAPVQRARAFLGASAAGAAGAAIATVTVAAWGAPPPPAIAAFAVMGAFLGSLGWLYLQGDLTLESPPRSSNEAPRESDPDRVVAFLASLPPGTRASRREIAQAVGVEARNVQRLVDAVNRRAGLGPGEVYVDERYGRGAGNQLQYTYALAPRPAMRINDQRSP